MITALGQALWVAVTVLLLGPIAVFSAASLKMRYRTGYRAAAAVTGCPCSCWSGVLAAVGYTPGEVIGTEYVPLFWLGAALLLVCWTGVMALRMV